MSEPIEEFIGAVMAALSERIADEAFKGANAMLDAAIKETTEGVLEAHAIGGDGETLTEIQLWTAMVDVLIKTDQNTNIGVLAAAIVRLYYADLNKKGARPDA